MSLLQSQVTSTFCKSCVEWMSGGLGDVRGRDGHSMWLPQKRLCANQQRSTRTVSSSEARALSAYSTVTFGDKWNVRHSGEEREKRGQTHTHTHCRGEKLLSRRDTVRISLEAVAMLCPMNMLIKWAANRSVWRAYLKRRYVVFSASK